MAWCVPRWLGRDVSALPRTVERLYIQPSSPWSAEHLSRYHLAATFVRGRHVLDIACGTGYGGSLLLAAGARTVIGVDSSRDAIAAATCHLQSGLEFVCADGTDLPFSDDSFDVVVSFETLEHIEADDRFVSELRRVLVQDGVIVLSTPNALHTRQIKGQSNPFHVREYEPEEVEALLSRHFAAVNLLGQRPAPRLRPCPYWEPATLAPTLRQRYISVGLWKLARRSPRALTSRIMRRPLYPGEHDFTFVPADVTAGHVTVAVCRG
ncbi:MAG: class I SAM-dependent methyltransferase [Acidimicrobiales bacterium]